MKYQYSSFSLTYDEEGLQVYLDNGVNPVSDYYFRGSVVKWLNDLGKNGWRLASIVETKQFHCSGFLEKEVF